MEQTSRPDQQRPQTHEGRMDSQPPASNEENGDQPVDSVPLYKNFKVVIPLFVIILGFAIAAYYWYMGTREYVTTDDAYIDANRVAVSTKILGRIDTLTVSEGDTVSGGQVLVRLDDTDLRAQLIQTRTALALAQENITLADVSLQKAQLDFKRAAAQINDNIITKEQYDHALSELESAKARYNISVAQSNSAKAQIGIIETQLRNTVILSPMDGVVSKRWVLPGDVVSPGQPVFTVYDLQNIWVTANLEETSIGILRSTDKVEVTVDAYPEVKFSGQVFQIGTNTASQFSLIPPNNASGNFTKVTQRVPVKISIKPADGQKGASHVELLPGMSVEVKVKVK
jgi:membrane fusion protein (multidrug efflux system)